MKKSRLMLFTFFVSSAFFLISCEEDDVTSAGDPSSEPKAAIGYAESESYVLENGDNLGQIIVRASKNLFTDASFNLVLLEGDTTGMTISDADGNTGMRFSIAAGTSSTKLNVLVPNDSEYNGIQQVVFGLDSLVGDNVFLAETKLSSGGNVIYVEFTVNIQDDEPIPPLISFVESSSSIDENEGGAQSILLEFSKPTIAAGTFDLAFGGTATINDDYTSDTPAGKVAFDAGVEELVIEITPIDNEDKDSDKTVILTMSNFSGGIEEGDITEHTLTLVDDELPTVEIIAEADAIVRNGSKSSAITSLDAATVQMSSGSDAAHQDNRNALLRFDISGVDLSKVVSATLVLTAADDWTEAETNYGGVTEQNIHHVTGSDAWDEATVVWDNAPSFEATAFVSKTFAVVGDAEAGSTVVHQYDVKETLITDSDGKFSIRMTVSEEGGSSHTDGKRIRYASKENLTSDNHPKLVIKTSE